MYLVEILDLSRLFCKKTLIETQLVLAERVKTTVRFLLKAANRELNVLFFWKTT